MNDNILEMTNFDDEIENGADDTASESSETEERTDFEVTSGWGADDLDDVVDITELLKQQEDEQNEIKKIETAAEEKTAYLSDPPYEVTQEKHSDETAQRVMKVIDGAEHIYYSLAQQKEEELLKNRTGEPKRSYKGKIPKSDVKFAKPVESEKSIVPKLIMFVALCIGAGVFLGVKANSYYVYKDGNVESALSCAISWIMEESLPTAITPFHSDVFFTGFGVAAAILGVIGLFIYLDSEQKKQSRVGHEHGNARLGKKNDFKQFKRKFMD